MDWYSTNLKELEILQTAAINNGFLANNYSSVNSILYSSKFKSQISIKDNWIFEKYLEDGTQCFSFPHNVDCKNDAVETVIKKLLKEASKTCALCVFTNITTEEKEILTKYFKPMSIESADYHSDYIYLTENPSSLAGGKYSKKRNHIKQFYKKHDNITFSLINSNNIDDAAQIEEKWYLENLADDNKTSFLEDLQTERQIIFDALNNFEYFSKYAKMSGGILYAEGKPVAFCLSSLLSAQITDIHFEKCLSSFAKDGGYAVINNEFAKTVTTKFINREEDLGLEGLKKAKLSYYPHTILEKFNVKINTQI